MAAHVAEWKFDEVKQIADLITKSKVVGIVEVGGIPAPQMQQMRKSLHGIATIRSAKNSLLNLALDEAEKQMKGISELKGLVNGQAAIIATDINPFKLFAKIKQSRTNAPAKGGEKVNHDIEIKAGETPFKPGPIVGELQKAGIPAAIQEGKVVIKTDKVLVPAGEKIKPDVAQMLTRLEIYPLEIGIGLNGVFENGTVFKPEVLDINIDEFILKLSQASGNAFILALEVGWANKQTIRPLIMKAYNNAVIVAIEKGIVNKETVKNLISKANSQMLALKNKTSS